MIFTVRLPTKTETQKRKNAKTAIMNFNNQAICITAGEQSENHAGMQINGNGLCQNGFSVEELEKICKTLEEKEIEHNYFIANYNEQPEIELTSNFE